MKWFRKWNYLILLLAAGMVYLSCFDKWQVYAGPLEKVKAFYDRMVSEEDPRAGAPGTGEGQNPPAFGGSDGNGTRGSSVPGTGEDASGADGDGQNETDASGGQLPGTNLGHTPGSPEGQSPEDADWQNPEGAAGQEGGEDAEPQMPELTYMEVEDNYFADAVFIGDSRTVGMYEYGGLGDISTFYASTGLTVYKLFDAEIAQVEGQKKKVSVETALQQNQFSKIYLMIGINEMGRGTVETFIEKYQEVVGRLQELQPEAIIYVQGIIKVTTARSEQGDYINNEGIVARNEELAKLADNENIFYLDVNPLICDETGGMEPEYTGDGVHLKAKYIDIWKNFLKSHAVSEDYLKAVRGESDSTAGTMIGAEQ